VGTRRVTLPRLTSKECIDITETSMRIRIEAWITVLAIVAFALTGCSRYSAEFTEGWVIDADTKKRLLKVLLSLLIGNFTKALWEEEYPLLI